MSESYVTIDDQSACLFWNKALIWRLRPDFYYCQTVAGLLIGRLLWREDGSVVYNCCWSSPAQSFSCPSPMGLMAIFYCHILDPNFSCLTDLGADHKENTASHYCFILLLTWNCCVRVCWRSRYLATDLRTILFTPPMLKLYHFREASHTKDAFTYLTWKA
jgi:hypothetical protein